MLHPELSLVFGEAQTDCPVVTTHGNQSPSRIGSCVCFTAIVSCGTSTMQRLHLILRLGFFLMRYDMLLYMVVAVRNKHVLFGLLNFGFLFKILLRNVSFASGFHLDKWDILILAQESKPHVVTTASTTASSHGYAVADVCSKDVKPTKKWTRPPPLAFMPIRARLWRPPFRRKVGCKI